MKDYEPRHSVHGGAGEIVVVSDADNVRVGEFIVEERIGIGSVAIVGAP